MRKSYRLANLDKDQLLKKQDDIACMLLCTTGIIEIKNLKTRCTFLVEGGGLPEKIDARKI